MHKTRGGREKQDELSGVIASLEPGAIHAVLVERAKYAALASEEDAPRAGDGAGEGANGGAGPKQLAAQAA
jgi:hypothetical protein